MQWTKGLQWFWRITATLLLITYSAACTHLPSGEKAFESFDSCFAANLGLAAVGGIGIGLLGAKLTEGITGSSSTGRTVGAAAGVAAGVMIAMHAWKQCAAVYNKSEVIAPPAARPVSTSTAATGAATTPRLTLDRLEVRVEGNENTPPAPEFDMSFAAANPTTKDIKAQFRHRVEIVRFMASEDDRLVLADDKGNAMRDSSGKEIPLEAAARMPRERLSWVPIAEDGKDDYVEDVVIQQGARARFRHKLQVPPRAKLPLPLPVPMRYTLSIEADNMKATRSVDFAILSTSARPKRYASTSNASALSAGQAPSVTTRSLSGAASSSPAATDTDTVTNRKTMLYSDTTGQRKPVGALARGVRLRVEERITAIIDNKPAAWVKVVTDRGQSGWLPAAHIGSKGR